MKNFAAGLVLWMCLCFCGMSEGVGREKRELKFPKGGSLVAGLALASLLPKGPTDGLAHVLEFDLGFPFPEEFAIDRVDTPKKSPNKKFKGKRSVEDQRRGILSILQDALDRLGFDGSSCASRFRCELQRISPNNSLVEELLAAFFEASPSNENCNQMTTCPVSLLHMIMHSQQILSLQG